MAKQRPHMELTPATSAMPKPTTPKGKYRSPAQPSGEVSTQKRSRAPDLDKAPMTPYERGFNPDVRPGSRREHTAPGGTQRGMAMNPRTSAMPQTGHMSATAPGALARPGSERGSTTMDARSSVPTSIQERCSAGDTRSRFGDTGMYEKNNARMDNAELDDGVGTGRRSRGGFRGNRRM